MARILHKPKRNNKKKYKLKTLHKTNIAKGFHYQEFGNTEDDLFDDRIKYRGEEKGNTEDSLPEAKISEAVSKQIKNFEKEGKYSLSNNDSKILLALSVFSSILFVLFMITNAIWNIFYSSFFNREVIVLISAILGLTSVLSCLITAGYKYTFDFNKRKFIKEYNIFFIHFEKVLADFTDINLLGVSSLINDTTETIIVYGESNTFTILESNSFFGYIDRSKNEKLEALAKIIDCEFLPCDGTYEIIVKKGNEYTTLKSLIMLVPKWRQPEYLNLKKKIYRWLKI